MTQSVLICNFQYYIVCGVDRVEGNNESIVTLRVLWAPLKKESYRLSHRKCRTFYEKLTDFLFFSLLVAYGIPLCNC